MSTPHTTPTPGRARADHAHAVVALKPLRR